MTLPAQFHGVVIDAKAFSAFQQFAHRRRLSDIRKDRWWGSLPWLTGFALGIYAALLGEQFFLAVMIAVCGGHFVWSQKRSIEADHEIGRYSPYTVELTISEEGITEDDSGIRSCIAWSAMKCWAICSDTLIIRLANGLCAMLPAGEGSKAPIPIREVAEVLRQKGVQEVSLSFGP